MNLRLFAVRNLTTGKIIPNTFFSSKAEAKKARDELGADTHRVTPGPDHRGYKL